MRAGFGELETNDPNYAYKYLTIPENISDISNDIKRIKRKLIGYERCYNPYNYRQQLTRSWSQVTLYLMEKSV
jgi:hypothetical protein